MRVLVTGRGEGKTTRLMDWVKAGAAVDGYPGWSRVVIVADLQSYKWIKDLYWRTLPDFDRRVYTMRDIQNGLGNFTSRNTDYRVDDMDLLLSTFFNGLRLDGFTITGQAWDDQLTLDMSGGSDAIH